jgi:DNA-binding SARP family transcriptional activator/tetratricopeptide (TPR) repeat protein
VLNFRLLGEVGAETGGRPVDVGHARQRAVLAVLLLEVNRPVPLDALIDRVWGEDLPRSPKNAVYGYLSRLRTVAPIDRRRGGYVLTADPMTVDAHRFEHLAERARATADDQAALDGYDEALGLWRGEPFAGLDSAWLTAVRERLVRLRQAAELDRNDVLIRLGRHDRVLAEAPAGTTNERLAGQVMLALHHGGRQADALRYFEDVRARLADQLGTDPSAALRGVQYEILTQSAPAAPRQLPASPPSFSGRARELAALTTRLDTARVVAVTGGGGIGKTWLALRWARDHADRFPDGQLYVNLRGFDPTGEPVRPEVAVRDLLDGLGAVPASIPAGLAAQTALYRSMTADRRMLVVLDNARDTAQIVPLLPGGESCTTLVTSRNQLTGLVSAHGASPLGLAQLTDAEATDLLTRRLGATADPAATQEIVRACAGLPLALGIAAARAATAPDLATLAAELRSARLDALDTDELTASLRAVFAVSYTALDEQAARACRLLARAPGVDIALPAAAHLLGDAQPVLRRLTAAHLVREYQPARYRMHDLVRLYLAEQTQDGDGPALARLAEYYLHATSAAMAQMSPCEGYRRPPVEPRFATFTEFAEARAWLDAERPNLLAAGAEDRTGRLAWLLYRYLDFFAYYEDALTLNSAALAAADPDDTAHGYALHHLGGALSRLGRVGEAVHHHERALRAAQLRGDRVLEGCAALGMATSYEQDGNDEIAGRCYEYALTIAREHGLRHLEAIALNDQGDFHRLFGRYEEASAALRQSLDIAWELRDLGLGAYVVGNLGEVYERLGQRDKAVDYLNQALDIARAIGNPRLEMDILSALGRATGSPEYGRQARAIAERIGHP